MSWTTCTVYNFADDLHWPELGILLENIDYHETARKASFLGSMCEDPLMAAVHFERRFDALMKYVINSQEHPIGKVKDSFYRVEFKIRGSCHYLVTTYFFWIESIPQDISCDTRDVLVQCIDSVLRQTSQTNQMWNYANWSNHSKLIVTVNIFKKHHLHLLVLSFLLFYKPFHS